MFGVVSFCVFGLQEKSSLLSDQKSSFLFTDVVGLQEKSNLLSDQKSSFYFITCMNVFGFLEKSSLPSDEKSSCLFYNLYECFWVARKV